MCHVIMCIHVFYLVTMNSDYDLQLQTSMPESRSFREKIVVQLQRHASELLLHLDHQSGK